MLVTRDKQMGYATVDLRCGQSYGFGKILARLLK